MKTLVFSALVMGLGAGLHCIFMCGPIVLALPLRRLTNPQRKIARFLHALGRWMMYAMMGALAGWVGKSLSWVGIQLPLVSLILFSVVFFVLTWHFDFSRGIRNMLAGEARKWQNQQRLASLFLLGMVNGLLPCGMVYAALAQSVLAASAEGAALLMLVFGLSSSWWQLVFVSGWETRLKQFQLFRFLAAPRSALVMLGLVLAFRLWQMHHPEKSIHQEKSALICRPSR